MRTGLQDGILSNQKQLGTCFLSKLCSLAAMHYASNGQFNHMHQTL